MLDGVGEAGAGRGAVGVESGERGTAVLVTVVEGRGDGRELDAGGVEVCCVGETGVGRVRVAWIRPGGVKAWAEAFGEGRLGVWGRRALVWAGVKAAVRSGRTGHAARVVVDLEGIRPGRQGVSATRARERRGRDDRRERARATDRRRASSGSESISATLASWLVGCERCGGGGGGGARGAGCRDAPEGKLEVVDVVFVEGDREGGRDDLMERVDH